MRYYSSDVVCINISNSFFRHFFKLNLTIRRAFLREMCRDIVLYDTTIVTIPMRFYRYSQNVDVLKTNIYFGERDRFVSSHIRKVNGRKIIQFISERFYTVNHAHPLCNARSKKLWLSRFPSIFPRALSRYVRYIRVCAKRTITIQQSEISAEYLLSLPWVSFRK